jgi:hypothetical protein
VDGLEDQVGVVRQLLGAVLELPGGLGGAGRAEHVPGGQLPVPAAQPVQALLFFFQLGQGELALADLAVDLSIELAAVGDELIPLRLPGLGEQLLQPRRVRLAPPGGLQHHHLAVTPAGQLDRPADRAGDGGHVRHRPAALP